MMIFKPTYTYQDIFKAFIDCRKRKRGSRSTIAFEMNFEENLLTLLDEINSGNYEVGRSIVFVVTKPKPREIWAATFRDRIVHHLVFNEINLFFEKRFIEDSYSCIKGRGSLAAADRLGLFHRRATNNYSEDVWFLQFDIKNFFGSIDKNILWELIKKHVNEGSKCYELIFKIIFNDPTVNAIIQRDSDFSAVPPHKSLWNAPSETGLPIGNLTSQFFSNLYLNELDQFIKHALCAKHYVRYVDDAIILSNDKAYLLLCLEQISHFLKSHLNIEIHPDKCFIKKCSQGMNFVGYIVKPYRRYARRTTVDSAKQSLRCLCKKFNRVHIDSLNSYLGIIRKSSSHKLRKSICKKAVIPTLVGHDAGFTKLIPL